MVEQNHYRARIDRLCNDLSAQRRRWVEGLNRPHAATAAASAELPIRLIKPDEFAAFHSKPAIKMSPTTIRVARKKNGMRLSMIVVAMLFTAAPGAFKTFPPSSYQIRPGNVSNSSSAKATPAKPGKLVSRIRAISTGFLGSLGTPNVSADAPPSPIPNPSAFAS